jgi:hypothetical protein
VSDEPDVRFEERLHVPLRWWVQAVMFLASLWLAFVVALPAGVAWGATGLLGAVVLALFLGYGGARIRVAGGVLQAGRAHIAVELLAAPVALDKAAAHRLAGRDADARAFLLLRPYTKRSVRVEVRDPSDPTPYWLLATRRPDELVRALVAEGVPAAGDDAPAPPGQA